MAGALPEMKEEYISLQRSTVEQGIVTTSILLGAVIGAALSTSICYAFRKKKAIFITGKGRFLPLLKMNCKNNY